ncbi:TPA: ABC transporter ATP-binding protein, partial [Enterococcus faecium]|nr:ABC transporter ATP-binding protein [Enterococcus faecium]
YLRPELIQFEPVPQGVKIPVLWKESFILGNIQRYVFQTLEGKEILVDRLNDREEKISDALYIQLKDILAIPVEIDTQHFAQQS